MTLILTRSDILGLLTPSAVLEAVRAAHADLARGLAVNPAPPVMRVPSSDGAFLAMVSASASARLAGVKLLADLPSNASRGLPTQRSALLMTSTDDGACEAVLDGGAITLFRTAAASALATGVLARPGSRTLGLVGAGAQAHAHLTALTAVLPHLDRVLVWSRSAETVRAFLDKAARQGTPVEAVPSARHVVEGSDVVCTLTPSRDPIVHGAWFRPGIHVNAVGAPPRPDHREIDSEGIFRARVVVDSRAGALQESGDILIPLTEGIIGPAHVADELGEVLAGTRPGRDDEDQITLYNSLGIGLQDLATARMIVDLAREKNMGREIDLAG
ncbi:ornithine cyclodeaminase family protein [Actinocorallia aurea]